MYRSFLNTLILGSLFFSFFTIAGNNVQGGVIYFRGEIVDAEWGRSYSILFRQGTYERQS